MKKIKFHLIIEKMIEQISENMFMKKFSLTKIEDISNEINVNYGTFNRKNITLETNQNNTLFKLHGLIQVVVYNIDTTDQLIIQLNTSLRPKEKLTINSLPIFIQTRLLLTGKPSGYPTENTLEVYPFTNMLLVSMEINTNGQINIYTNIAAQHHAYQTITVYFPSCIYSLKNYEDKN